MGGATPEEPVLYPSRKPHLCDIRQPLAIPADMGLFIMKLSLLLIGAKTLRGRPNHVRKAIAGYGVALDLTPARYSRESKKGRTAGKAKGFDNMCPISGFILSRGLLRRRKIRLSDLTLMAVRQQGSTADMIHPYCAYIAHSRPLTRSKPGTWLANRHAGRPWACNGDELGTMAKRCLPAFCTCRQRR